MYLLLSLYLSHCLRLSQQLKQTPPLLIIDLMVFFLSISNCSKLTVCRCDYLRKSTLIVRLCEASSVLHWANDWHAIDCLRSPRGCTANWNNFEHVKLSKQTSPFSQCTYWNMQQSWEKLETTSRKLTVCLWTERLCHVRVVGALTNKS